MINLASLAAKLRSRGALIAIVLVLAVLNLGRFTLSWFESRQEDLRTRVALLEQNRAAVAKLEALRATVQSLEERKNQLSGYWFRGDTEEQIASAMQIAIQEKVAKSGLAPESIRPVTRGGKKEGEERVLLDLPIKLRLSGTLDGFLSFSGELYQSKEVYIIESFVLKPTKGSEVKILIDLIGYYMVEGEKKEAKDPKEKKDKKDKEAKGAKVAPEND